ncbi:DUF4253 domain-containing protein [Actinoplanes awajinensis]|uniref:DUF4253 domain-containing protein n=1 Tax=Actinoplanes awajinensis subsp. mycoplanecinus TaxID=135947 RepID=A0A101J8W0_9ACTN|nr:DUF4253 domain-containing protein [Actinoplanes awajinensis]KUL22281.1 hypothetical protein ADL15_49120 [Actinoplanes awajinensis subsp. mycoplanecinus]
MAEDIDGVRQALAGTMLANLPLAKADGDALVISGLNPADVLTAWRAARQLMPATGRRPVFISGESALMDGYDEDEEDGEDDVATAVHLMDDNARTLDPWTSLDPSRWDLPDDDPEFTVGDFTGVDLLAEVRRHVTDPTVRTINRYVYDRVRTDPALLAQLDPRADQLTGTATWYEPEDVHLLLLPTTEAHLVAAWISYHQTLGEEQVLAAVLRQWHESWQAEVVACWETMLQFTVGRPPASPDDAWQVALQIAALASRLEMNPWEIALAVSHGTEWFLHSRP